MRRPVNQTLSLGQGVAKLAEAKRLPAAAGLPSPLPSPRGLLYAHILAEVTEGE